MKLEPRMKKGRQPISTRLIVLLVVTFLTAKQAMVLADETSCDAKAQPSKALCGVGRSPLCCPNDYIRKPVPCVSPDSFCCPDTYCPKPILVLPCPAKSCCRDDYCPSRCPRVVATFQTPGTSACRWCLVSGGELRRPLAKTNEFSYRLNGIHIDLNSAIIVRANVEARFDRLTRSGSNPRLWSPAAKRTLTRLSMSLRQDHQPQ